MACEFPIKAFDTGCKSETGKRIFIYARPGTDYYSLENQKSSLKVMPSKIFKINGHAFLKDPVPIPCGKCQACLLDQARELSTRAVLESQFWRFAYFVTLTYHDKCLPFDNDGEACLRKEDLKKFFNRLRNVMHFRYVACGEYGEHTLRPHYHFIMFTDTELNMRLDGTGVNKYVSSIFFKYWPYGMHQVSIADSGCISYVCGYVLKKVELESNQDKHMPFRLMSRHPGLGFKYLKTHDVLKDRKVYGDFGKNSKSRPVPSAFIRHLENKGYDVESFKQWNVERGETFQQLVVSAYGISDPEDLAGARKHHISVRFKKSRKESL